MKAIFKIASACLLLACPSIALNAQTVSEEKSWEQVKKQALDEHKLIFVDLYFTGCKPCAEMDRDVYPDPKVAPVLQSGFVTLKTNVMKEEIGKKLSMKYGVTGFPTLLFLNPDGRVIELEAGYHSADQFLTLMQKVADNNAKGIFKKYSTQINEKEYPEFYKKAYLEGKRNVPFETIDAYLKTQPSVLDEVPFVIITGLGAGKQYDDIYLKNAGTLLKNFGKSSVQFHVFRILMKKRNEFGKKNDLEGLKKQMNEVKPIFSTEEWAKYEDILLKDFDKLNAASNSQTLNK